MKQKDDESPSVTALLYAEVHQFNFLETHNSGSTDLKKQAPHSVLLL